MTKEDTRLIETAFPIKRASIDSVHEKNVRHGHISTLHIWPARRPLAASRAALIATLLPDPGDTDGRRSILSRMAGRIAEKIERKRINGRVVEKVKAGTVGGILHWGRENDADMDWFRSEIRKAYGGRAPKVLDPFAGGGAIPLEALRLGCDVIAIDINPVAWFILKCTLQYPQQLAGQTQPLPSFALEDKEFAEEFLKSKGLKGASLRTFLERLGHGQREEGIQLESLPHDDPLMEADLAWHVRAWGAGHWAGLDANWRTTTHLCGISAAGSGCWEKMSQPQLLEVDDDGLVHVNPLNAEFGSAYLADSKNPRWVAKPPVAYLWARTVSCKQCRIVLPLLKTSWLCKTDRKRVLLEVTPSDDRTGVVFAVQADPPPVVETLPSDESTTGGSALAPCPKWSNLPLLSRHYDNARATARRPSGSAGTGDGCCRR